MSTSVKYWVQEGFCGSYCGMFHLYQCKILRNLENSMSTIFCYQLREQLKPLALAVMGIALLFLSRLLYEVGNYILVNKVPVQTILQLLFYKLPAILVTALPVGTLFAVMFTLGKLAENRELLTMRMAGMTCRRIILPYLTVALMVSGIVYVINERVVPWADHEGEVLIRRIIFQSPPPELTQNVFFKDKNRFFHIETVDTAQNRLLNIVMYEINDGRAARVITAKAGNYYTNMWVLNDGVIHEFDKNGFISYEMSFTEFKVNIEQANENLFRNQRSTNEMNRAELRQLIHTLRERSVDTAAFEVEYHVKSALPLATFIFVLLGAPLIVRAHVREKFYSAALSIGIALLYFVLVSFIAAAGRAKLLPPLWAAWLPNIISLSCAAVILWWADRR
jgi:lipopolysaccharide export system permease protein